MGDVIPFDPEARELADTLDEMSVIAARIDKAERMHASALAAYLTRTPRDYADAYCLAAVLAEAGTELADALRDANRVFAAGAIARAREAAER